MQQIDKISYKNAFELLLLSAISLYVELLIIRWVSADIRAFTIFRTFPLIACFVGFGVGFALRNDKNYRHLPFAILLFAISMKAADFYGISLLAFPALSVFQWNNLLGLTQVNTAYLALFMLVIILFLAIPFGVCVCIGCRLGVLFSSLKPLSAYSLNVGGAILGSILFPILSVFGFAPWQLLLLPTTLIAADLVSKTDKLKYIYAIPIVLITVIFMLVPDRQSVPLIPALRSICQISEAKTLWSPYQRIDLSVFTDKTSMERQFLGLELSVNHLFYQYFLNLQKGNIFDTIQLADKIRQDYDLPFSFNEAKDVLIVGAGTGQNVSAAIGKDASKIDAVEIDPLILAIGRKYNRDYSKPNVHLICDDARHFMSTTTNRYDVINFSTLDSHTVAGLGSSVRLDSYIYTKESIIRALSLLKDKGVIHISFVTIAPWIKERLFTTFSQAAGYDPIVLEGKTGCTIYLLGPPIANGTLKVPQGFVQLKMVKSMEGRVLTDDWPYLYVRPDIIDWPNLLVVAEIILISIYAARRFLFAKNDLSVWHMFFLGAAFMLLELHGISFLSLLYGSTWMTSAVVINSILVMILITNYFVIRFPSQIEKHLRVVYTVLFASILFDYFLPTELLLGSSLNHFIVYSFMTILTVLPMGIAALIFSTAFAKAPNVSQAFAFNLFGVVVGGLLECLSNWWGIKSLNLVAVGLYLASAFCYFKNNSKTGI